MAKRPSSVTAILPLLVAACAFADRPEASQSSLPADALHGLEKAAQAQGVQTLDLVTLGYRADANFAYVDVDAQPARRADGSEDGATLTCHSWLHHARDWLCGVQRYQAIRVTPVDGGPERVVQVYDGALDLTRKRATEAFVLMNESARVTACPKVWSPMVSTESLREIFGRQHGPYRLYDVPDGYELVRGPNHVRITLTAPDGSARIACWEQETLDE